MSTETTFETPDETLPVEWVAREDLLPNDWNPNVMGESKRDELVYSIHDNGWTQPIVVKGETDTIIDGEQRWHASGHTVEMDGEMYCPADDESLTPEGVDAGYVPIYRVSVSEEQARVATLQHNKATGTHDVDELANLLADLDGMDALDEAQQHLNIDDPSLDRLLDRASADIDGAAPEPEDMFDIPWADDGGGSGDGEDGAIGGEDKVTVRRIDFLITEEEVTQVNEVLTDDQRADIFIALCEMALEEGWVEETRIGFEDEEDDDDE